MEQYLEDNVFILNRGTRSKYYDPYYEDDIIIYKDTRNGHHHETRKGEDHHDDYTEDVRAIDHIRGCFVECIIITVAPGGDTKETSLLNSRCSEDTKNASDNSSTISRHMMPTKLASSTREVDHSGKHLKYCSNFHVGNHGNSIEEVEEESPQHGCDERCVAYLIMVVLFFTFVTVTWMMHSWIMKVR